MDRRNFLKSAAIASAGLILGPRLLASQSLYSNDFIGTTLDAIHNEGPIYSGWVQTAGGRLVFIKNNPKPFMNQLDNEIRGTGAGKQAILWPFFEKVTGGPLKPHQQRCGDCVGQAYGLGVDILTAVQIVKRNSPQRWVAKAATEVIYGGGRIEIGKNIYNKYFGGDGLEGFMAAEFIKKYGVLLRQKYLDWDFTNYDPNTARSLGDTGIPDALEPLCRLHPVGWVALVNSWEEARDCIYNGYPVILCSTQGFYTKHGRDKNGYLSPGRAPWEHAMLLAGIDEACDRPGGCIINSWGSDWVDGGTKLNQPAGSFWADANVIDRICKQGDSIAISSYAGYPRQDYNLW
jgi:hypothetical protein